MSVHEKLAESKSGKNCQIARKAKCLRITHGVRHPVTTVRNENKEIKVNPVEFTVRPRKQNYRTRTVFRFVSSSSVAFDANDLDFSSIRVMIDVR